MPPQYPQQPARHPSYGAMPPPVVKKKPWALLGVLGGVGLLMVAGGIIGVAAWSYSGKGKLPVSPDRLPSQTTSAGTQYLSATREKSAHVKSIYLASELGASFCEGKAISPADNLDSAVLFGSKAATEFFDPSNIDAVRVTLQCGSTLATELKDDHVSFVVFGDDKKPHTVKLAKLKMTDMPSGEGFTRFTFGGGTQGFCRTDPPAPPLPAGVTGLLGATAAAALATRGSSGPGTCDDATFGAFPMGDGTWAFGPKDALDDFADSVAHPKSAIGAKVSALRDAAAETSKIENYSVVAEPDGVKRYLEWPCQWAETRGGIFRSDFVADCFPEKSDERLLSEIDAKVRAVAYGTDPDYATAGAVAGDMVFVARDEASAGDLARSLAELVDDWKDLLDRNSSKLINEIREKSKSGRQKEFATVVDTYFAALGKMKVKRDGRAVKVSFREPLSKEDKQEMLDAAGEEDKRREAVADVLDAIRNKQAIPTAALGKLVGPKWATYLTLPPLPTPPTPTMVSLTEGECESIKGKLNAMNSAEVLGLDPEAFKEYLDQKYASCSDKTPTVLDSQRPCLTTFVTASEYVRCVSSAAGGDPRRPPEDEFGKLK